jgi:hypothetical protein
MRLGPRDAPRRPFVVTDLRPRPLWLRVVMRMPYKIGDEVVLRRGPDVPNRLVGWRAVVQEITPDGKLRVHTGNEIRTVTPEQVKRARKGDSS